MYPAGGATGTLTFSFSSSERFAPAQVPVTLTVHGWIQSNLALAIPGLVLALVILAGIVFLVFRAVRGKPMQFSVLVDDAPAEPESVSLGAGGELFLNDNGSGFALVPHRNARSVARFSVAGGALSVSMIKADRFPKVAQFPPDALGKTFPMRTETGRNATLKIQPSNGAAAPKQDHAVAADSPAAATGRPARTAPKAIAKKRGGARATREPRPQSRGRKK